jgi:hypothetical protein
MDQGFLNDKMKWDEEKKALQRENLDVRDKLYDKNEQVMRQRETIQAWQLFYSTFCISE